MEVGKLSRQPKGDWVPELHTQSGYLRRQKGPSLSVRELYLHTEGSDPSEDQRMRTWPLAMRVQHP